MSYYRILGLEKEPFSTSPDPDFFYNSREHKSALYRLRISIELKRGLSLILGEVGTGKTTLSRRLAQLLSKEPNINLCIILNPVYESEEHFCADLIQRFHIPFSLEKPTLLDYMKAIEKFLFETCLEQGKTVVLLIDESQKLVNPCLETLRSLLNYETNEYKVLQLILMGQIELLPRISKIKNLWDRISLKAVLNPLEENEVRELIEFRLKVAGYNSRYPLFSDEAIKAIYHFSRGYPRRIAIVCHDALEYLIMHKKEMVEKAVINDLKERELKQVLMTSDAG